MLPLVAICLTTLMVATAFSVDLGREVAENRRLQAVADAAALDGSRQLTGGNYSAVYTRVYNAVTANAAKNNVSSPENVLAVEVGTWDPTTEQFTAVTSDAGQAPNAVRVTLHDDFTNLFSIGHQSLSRSSVADFNGLRPICTGTCTTTTTVCGHDCGTTTTTVCTGLECNPHSNEAGFAIGSYAVAINTNCPATSTAAVCLPAVLLDKLLHSSTSLGITGAGYQGLANTDMTLGALLKANATVGTLNALLTSSFTGAQFGTIFANAVQYCENPNPDCNASNNLAQINAYTAAIQTAFSAGGWSTIQLGSIFGTSTGEGASAGSANVNLGQLLYGGATLFNGAHAVSLSTPTGVLGDTATASLYLISPQNTYWGYTQPLTASPTTDTQANGTLTLNLGGVSGASNVVVTLPVTLAEASGWLTAIDCTGGSNSAPTSFTVHVTTSGASVGNPGGGTVSLTVLGVAVTGTTTGAVAGNGSGDPVFPAPYPGATQTVSASTGVPSLSVTLNLTGNASVDAQLASVQASLTTNLNAGLNPTLNNLHQVVGINTGNADVTPIGATPVDCQAPLLVK